MLNFLLFIRTFSMCSHVMDRVSALLGAASKSERHLTELCCFLSGADRVVPHLQGEVLQLHWLLLLPVLHMEDIYCECGTSFPSLASTHFIVCCQRTFPNFISVVHAW